MTGKVIALGRKEKPYADVEELPSISVSIEAGIAGDARGVMKDRQISVMTTEAWDAVMADLQPDRALPWTIRRANILTEGFELPRQVGARFTIGSVVLEVMDECTPCSRMQKAYKGLRQAMEPDWRGGVLCNVIEGGAITVGDPVTG